MDRTGELKRLILQSADPVVAPGVYDCISARIAERVGFRTCVITGNGLSGSVIGKPDLSLLSFGEILHEARNIASSVSIPVVADADTGYGDALNMIRTVQEMERAGVSGLFVEDQRFPKRCSYLPGAGNLVETDDFVRKVKAARWAAESADFVIIARTDALVHHSIDDAIDRGNRYGDAGADAIFVVGISNPDQLLKIRQDLTYPLMININEGEPLSDLRYSDLSEIGVDFVMYPNVVRGTVLKALDRTLGHLLRVGDTVGLDGDISVSTEFSDLMDIERYMELQEKFE